MESLATWSASVSVRYRITTSTSPKIFSLARVMSGVTSARTVGLQK